MEMRGEGKRERERKERRGEEGERKGEDRKEEEGEMVGDERRGEEGESDKREQERHRMGMRIV